MGMSFSKLAVCVGLCFSGAGALMAAVGPNVPRVTCDLGRPCHLTCTHHLPGITDLHWVQDSGSHPVIYDDYGNGNRFIHPDFKGKLSEIRSRGSDGGLVSDLCLLEPGVHSESLYLCQARNHLNKYSRCSLNLTVKAPVTDIDIWRERNQVVCRSKRNYPEPRLRWLLKPSWENVNKSNVFKRDPDGLFSVSGYLDLPHSEEVDGNHTVSCVVGRDHDWKKGTWTQRALLASPDADPWIPCAPDSNETFHSITWTFNQKHSILSQNGSGDSSFVVFDDWKENVKNVSAWGDLQLKDLSPKKAGLYTCVAKGAVNTFVTDTVLNVDQALMAAVGPNVPRVTCDLGRPCHLTCTHHLPGITDLHWIQDSGSHPVLYDDYGNGDLFIHPDFKGKLSEIRSRGSDGGLVSDLCLWEPGVHSESLYLCEARNHLDRSSRCSLNLTVKAPVTDIDIWRERNQVVCRSKRNYPEPRLRWLLEPSWENVNKSNGFKRDPDGLFSVSGYLDLPHSEEVDGNHTVSCVVGRDHDWKKGTWTQRALLASPDADPWIPCAPDSNETFHSITWTFNQKHSILSQNGSGDSSFVVFDDWKENVKNVSAWGDLQLKDLSPKKAGLYTCVAKGAVNTFVTDTVLNVDQGNSPLLWCLMVLVGAFVLLVVLIFQRLRRQSWNRVRVNERDLQ